MHTVELSLEKMRDLFRGFFFFLVPDPLGVFRPGALPFKAISFNQVMGLENAQVVPSPGGLWLSPCFPAVP